MTKRIIGVFTGNRAEYGLQYPILKAIAADPRLDYRLVVSGAHLDPRFGRTLEEIEADGFTVHAEAKIDMPDDPRVATPMAIGSGILDITRILTDLQPDIWLVYADRFEGFAAVIAATQMNIPTGHIEGGDLTEGGALDDSVRHAMTKLSHLHFTTNDQASARLLGMGEEPWRVHTVGFPAIDLIQLGSFAKPAELQQAFGLDFSRPVIIFTQHSITTQVEKAREQLLPTIAALRRLAEEGVQILATYPNNDAGSLAIIEELQRLSQAGVGNIQVHRSVGRYRYHGILALARDPAMRVACVGNSSSGIKETPAFGCPAVNIGSRQDGRLRAENVIDAAYDADAIHGAVRKALDDDDFRRLCAECSNPYGVGDAGRKIADVVAAVDLGEKLLRKRMTLLGETRPDGWFR